LPLLKFQPSYYGSKISLLTFTLTIPLFIFIHSVFTIKTKWQSRLLKSFLKSFKSGRCRYSILYEALFSGGYCMVISYNNMYGMLEIL